MRALKDFGAWVAIVGMIGAGLIGWGAISSKVEAHTAALQDLTPKVNQSITDVAVIRSQVDAIAKGVDRLEDNAGTKPR